MVTVEGSLDAYAQLGLTSLRKRRAMAEEKSGAAGAGAEVPPPKILLRRPGTLELFRGPSKEDGKEEPADLAIEPGFPEVDASSTEWSK